MAPSPGRHRKHGLVFYTTALVISLFTVYSILCSFSHDARFPQNQLVARKSHTENEECRLVHNSHDKCAFVKANCPDEEAGLVSYLQFYYCSPSGWSVFAFVVLVIWLSLLFSTIGIAASDFLCINLSTIASILGMSESLTGVTFLALGNGSPDVFSTFAAMSSHSGSLAIGELIGAASFITAVVAGSMALVKPFQVARKSFIRDVGFFAVASSFSLVFLADGNLRLWECITMIAFYLFYVAFVVAWHWWLGWRRKLRLAEATARMQHHIPDAQELDAPDFNFDEEAMPADEHSRLLRTPSGDLIPTIIAPGTPAWRFQEDGEDDETRDRYLAELQANMRVSRPTRERRNTITPIRPSLIGALEFRSILNTLEKKSTNPVIGLRRYSEDVSQFLGGAPVAQAISQPELLSANAALMSRSRSPSPTGRSGRSRAVSANDADGLKINPGLLSTSTGSSAALSDGSQTPMDTKRPRPSSDFLRDLNDSGRPVSPKLLLSPSELSQSSELIPVDHSHLVPPVPDFHRPVYDESNAPSIEDIRSPSMSPRGGSTLQVPVLRSPHPESRKSPLHQSFPAYTDSPMHSPLHSPPRSLASSRPPSIRLPAPRLSIDSSPQIILLNTEEEEDGDIRFYKWWPYRYLPAPQILTCTLFPTLYGWRSKSVVDKLLGVVTAPSVFLLTLTLPVVEAQVDDESQEAGPVRSGLGTPLPSETPTIIPKPSDGDGPPHPHGTNLARHDSDFPVLAVDPIGEDSKSKDWNRWLVIVQLFTAPFFTVTILWANVDDAHQVKAYIHYVLGSLVFSIICLVILLATTSPHREPKLRPLLCFLGFAVAIAWISTIANEVVGVLKAFGVILNISDAILGLTVFAVGNSLGDLVADITVAKLGYPVMALSACFGGPMLNILLGIGISGFYMTVKKEKHTHKKHPNRPIEYKPYEIQVSTTLMISGVALLTTLVGLLVVVPLNGWRMDRKIGWGLIALWSISTIGNLVVEITGYGGELQ